MKRTFFTIKRGGTVTSYYEFVVADRFTFEDMRESLIVERVSARLDGILVSELDLLRALPEAVTAAFRWMAMKIAVKSDPSLRGPYILLTEAEPTGEYLLRWFGSGTGHEKLPTVFTDGSMPMHEIAAQIGSAESGTTELFGSARRPPPTKQR